MPFPPIVTHSTWIIGSGRMRKRGENNWKFNQNQFNWNHWKLLLTLTVGFGQLTNKQSVRPLFSQDSSSSTHNRLRPRGAFYVVKHRVRGCAYVSMGSLVLEHIPCFNQGEKGVISTVHMHCCDFFCSHGICSSSLHSHWNTQIDWTSWLCCWAHQLMLCNNNCTASAFTYRWSPIRGGGIGVALCVLVPDYRNPVQVVCPLHK